MGVLKPYHRTVRAMKPRDNAGYSAWAYIRDRSYARQPEHYVRAYLLIQADLQSIFEYVEPSDASRTAFSYRIHALLMRTCIEIEANFKAILEENDFTPKGRLSITDYRKIDVTHHLSSYAVHLPIWNGTPPQWKPFEPWLAGRDKAEYHPLPWYQAYNASKHDRHEAFKQANLEHLISAVAALLIVISAQFKGEDFSAGSDSLGIAGHDYHPFAPATGSLFRIKYPDDWSEAELYDFNWSTLRNEPDRFEKIDYDAIA